MKQKRIRMPAATLAIALLSLGVATSAAGEASVAAAAAPSNPTIFLRATGESQGQLIGGSTDARCTDCMEVYGFSHEVVSPRDAASGLPTGRRQHKPIVVTKQVDRATPLLYHVLANNENVTEFELLFFRDNERIPYYTIQLMNANIASIRSEQSPGSSAPPREHVAFVYQKIIWTWEDGGISAEDDWESPSA